MAPMGRLLVYMQATVPLMHQTGFASACMVFHRLPIFSLRVSCVGLPTFQLSVILTCVNASNNWPVNGSVEPN